MKLTIKEKKIINKGIKSLRQEIKWLIDDPNSMGYHEDDLPYPLFEKLKLIDKMEKLLK